MSIDINRKACLCKTWTSYILEFVTHGVAMIGMLNYSCFIIVNIFLNSFLFLKESKKKREKETIILVILQSSSERLH